MMAVETIRELPRPSPTPSISIDFEPHGSAFTFNVGETVYNPPNAYYGSVGEILVFEATVDFPDALRQPIAYEWDFGDGVIGHGNPASYEYKFANTYTVRLSIVDTKNGIWHAYKTMYVVD